jgi:teichuronic acid biosynthesis glycosyltransferase TuaH
MPKPDFVFIDQPLFKPAHFKSSVVVFRPTDIFAPGLMTRRALAAARTSDGIAATSPGVLQAYGDACDGPQTVIENGVEFATFRRAAIDETTKHYDFVYVGAIDDRFSFPLLIEAAQSLPRRTFAVFGPIPVGLPVLPPNIEMRGSVRYEQVPRVLARGRWGIMPFADTPLNASRSPMKLYEYVAAGLPVIAPQVALARASGIGAASGYDPADPASFVAALGARIAAPNHGVSESDLATAAQMDWHRIAQRLLTFATHISGETTGKVAEL